jgi:CRISPR-associated endoribonuclease Cas6
MTRPELLSLILRLRLQKSSFPAEKKDWYGRAAQALCLSAIKQASSAELSARLHSPNQIRPYTVSNLMPDTDDVRSQASDPTCFLRFTALNQEVSAAMLAAIADDGPLAVEQTLNLSGMHLQIIDVAINPDQHPWAGVSTYEQIRDQVRLSSHHQPLPIRFEYYSPTHFKTTIPKSGSAVPLPHLVFGSLYSRWQRYAGIEMPASLQDFILTSVKLEEFDLRTKEIDTGRFPRIGSLGWCCYSTSDWRSPCWTALRMLAAFAQYAGVGKETAVGFGQAFAEQLIAR